MGWGFFGAVGLVFLIASLVGLLTWKPVLNLWADSFLKRLMKDPYPGNV